MYGENTQQMLDARVNQTYKHVVEHDEIDIKAKL